MKYYPDILVTLFLQGGCDFNYIEQQLFSEHDSECLKNMGYKIKTESLKSGEQIFCIKKKVKGCDLVEDIFDEIVKILKYKENILKELCKNNNLKLELHIKLRGKIRGFPGIVLYPETAFIFGKMNVNIVIEAEEWKNL